MQQMHIKHFSKIFTRICWLFFQECYGVEWFTFIPAIPDLVYLCICYFIYCNHIIINWAHISGLFGISLTSSFITAQNVIFLCNFICSHLNTAKYYWAFGNFIFLYEHVYLTIDVNICMWLGVACKHIN